MKHSLRSLVAIGVSTSLASTVACSAKVTVDLGSNASTGGTTSSQSTGGVTSSSGGTISSTGPAALPFEIIGSDGTIFELTTDSNSVYWPAANYNSGPTHSSASLSIRSYSAGADAGVANTYLLATILPSFVYPPIMLKIDGDWMYWKGEAYDVNDLGRLYRCRKLGCSDVQNMGIDPNAYVVTDGELYWSTTDGKILSCDADDCGATTKSIDVQTPAGQPKFQGANPIAVDGDYLYMDWAGGLARVPRAGSAPYEAIEPDFEYGAFIHGDNIYWTENAKPNAVYSCPKSGCKGDPTPVMKNIVYGQHITHDDDTIYVLDMPSFPTLVPGNQRLLRCPISGCNQPVVVLTDDFNTYAVTSDNQYIYAAVALPSKGINNANPDDHCSDGRQCTVVLKIPK